VKSNPTTDYFPMAYVKRRPLSGAENSIKNFLIEFLLILSSLLINPLFIAPIAAFFQTVLKKRMLFYFGFLIAYIFMGFWLRDYGVQISEHAGDDVPEYFRRVSSDGFQSINSILLTFLLWPSGGEPLWYLLNIPLSSFWESIEGFAFFNYLAIGLALGFLLFKILKELSIIGILVFFFVAAEVSYGFFHIWRQGLSTILIIGGYLAIKENRENLGIVLFLLSGFAHLIGFLFFTFYIFYSFPKLLNGKKFPLPLSILTVIVFFIVFGYMIAGYFGKSRYMNIVFLLNTDFLKLSILFVTLTTFFLLSKSVKKCSASERTLFFIIGGMLFLGMVFPSLAHRLLIFIIPLAFIVMLIIARSVFSSRDLYILLFAMYFFGVLRLNFFSEGAFQSAYYGEFFSLYNPIWFSVI
jgi:hypothetical protein